MLDLMKRSVGLKQHGTRRTVFLPRQHTNHCARAEHTRRLVNFRLSMLPDVEDGVSHEKNTISVPAGLVW